MKILFRQPALKDVNRIHKIAEEFYKGFEISQEVLANWIKNLLT